ncbi:MAG: efflux RND transporter periplasmic adaptor subunit [Thermoanaerobaculales bacterium]|nr:efflux RND transporter periplasmic adaptor subunit [Thermoanaerobaculales bacterium]
MRAIVLSPLVLFSLTLAASEVVELDPQQMARAGVVVGEVGERSFSDRQRLTGRVVRVPGSTLTLKTPVGGRVEQISVAPGDRVRAGQPLVSLHSHELLTMQSDLLRTLEAGRELYAVEGISRIDLEQREQEAFAVDLELEVLREELVDHGFPDAALERVLETRTTDPHLPVAAPVDGVVLELAVEEHEWVEELQALLVVGDPQRLELELQIAPDQAPRVHEGDGVVFAPVGRPEGPGRATVLSRVPQVDPDTRTIRVRARIVEPGSQLYAGLYVEGQLTQGEARVAPAVPESAVINLAGDDVVFVSRGGASFEARRVELGAFDGGYHEVVTGLATGDRVATGGVFLLKSALIGGGEGD